MLSLSSPRTSCNNEILDNITMVSTVLEIDELPVYYQLPIKYKVDSYKQVSAGLYHFDKLYNFSQLKE